MRACADALETQTRLDAVDILLRSAIAPTVDPFLATFARTPATANLLAAFIGQGTPLVCCLSASAGHNVMLAAVC